LRPYQFDAIFLIMFTAQTYKTVTLKALLLEFVVVVVLVNEAVAS